ncbi:phage tail-collar fiber domain-containing protein [Pectobacterium aroidearum]|uniref:phage tail-collar fiber domain-containing protein n=1 Tax=Pectobacterium aroidearum TaxID=1201031 RepID=UPI0026076FF5|nr:phage tail protein [Pectobacterium aroidearum]WKA63699.1 phage tail protein [Pectobacterium aroidearum]
MAQSAVTRAFEAWNVNKVVDGLPAVPDSVVFALIPDQDETAPVSRDEGMPAAATIKHTADITQHGVLNDNAVVYSVVLDTNVGDWDYNWIGLVDSKTNTVLMIVHVRTQQKVKTKNGQQGNSLTRNLAMQFDGAADATQINVSAATWQIDFSARLFGMDEAHRLSMRDYYGAAAFLNDGFRVALANGVATIAPGIGYVGGLRTQLDAPTTLNVSANTSVWLDVSRQGTVTGAWENRITFTAATNLADYVDQAGYAHYVTRLGEIVDGKLTDSRPVSPIVELDDRFLRKDQNGADIPDKTKFLSTLVYRGELANGGTFAACNQVGVYRVAIKDGNTVTDMPKNIRGESLYSYGFLLVNEIGGVISQMYLPHRGPVATRQAWDGVYSLGWNVMLDGLTNKPSATEIGAFPLGFTGAVNNSDVAWNANSGVYQALFAEARQMIVHFFGGAASCPSLQFLAEYGNGGLSYRTARDGMGFERPWAKLYTTQFKPTADDVGALPITGGALQGGIRIGAGNIDLPATRAVVGIMPDASYRQMLSLSPDNTVVVGNPNSSTVIHTNDRVYIAAAGGAWRSVYHEGNLTPSTIGALPTSELVGMPQLFPGAVAPEGWLKCNGQQFDTAQFPVLASRYPSGSLPDLRGEFVRGWDDGRGVDAGRALLSAQSAFTPPIPQNGWGTNGVTPTTHDPVVTSGHLIVGSGIPEINETLESLSGAGHAMTVTGDTRPRNIAFNYIVRAA